LRDICTLIRKGQQFIVSITTKNGDEGRTRLATGEAVWKDDPRLEALGDLDELTCALGEARARMANREHAGMILDIQLRLSQAAAEVAFATTEKGAPQHAITPEQLAELEQGQAQLEAECITLPDAFVLPGGSLAGAALDLARAVTRRVERRVVALCRQGVRLERSTCVYLNRLSDFLWVLARREEPRTTVMD